MDEITLKNFRCFREEQTVCLAPLTLLVGENSTGKTSFLAMIRALWNVAFGRAAPDFKDEVYDLGSFDEIVHNRGGSGEQANSFEAGFTIYPGYRGSEQQLAFQIPHIGEEKDKLKMEPFRFHVVFQKMDVAPALVERRLSCGKLWIEERLENILKSTGQFQFQLYGSQPEELSQKPVRPPIYGNQLEVSPAEAVRALIYGDQPEESPSESTRPYINHSSSMVVPFSTLIGFTSFDLKGASTKEGIRKDVNELISFALDFESKGTYTNPPYASAPVRSRPRRNYDPSPIVWNPEGQHIPGYLASLHSQNQEEWEHLKNAIGRFGKQAELFDEILVRYPGEEETDPFQLQVRRFGSNSGDPRYNLVDVGYGVSQVLPVITELLRRDAPKLFLMQQPEVHLHPKAQAALGSLFCDVAGEERQLVVETHSDHLLDRVRMDVRDGKSKLKPRDVSILFFERCGLDVYIHSIGLDEEGQVVDAPESYRKFFMEETNKMLGLD